MLRKLFSGIILATWSASISNLIGASRVVFAVALDKIFGPVLNIVARGSYKDNPILAVLITGSLIQLCFLIGSLNEIAQLSSVLYLLSYCAVNISCLCLDLSSAPNFRPNFRYFHWTTSLVGLFGCGVMIFLIRSDRLADPPKH